MIARIVVVCGLAAASFSAIAAETLKGRVAEVTGDQISVRIEGDLAPIPGDPVTISVTHDVLGEISVGQWAVTSVAGRVVTADLKSATGPAATGMVAAIRSDAPVPVEEDVAGGEGAGADLRSEADAALFHAVGKNDLKGFRSALDTGASLTARDNTGHRAIDIAVQMCRYDFIVELSNRGADILAPDFLNVSPMLHAADKSRCWRGVALFAEAGGDVDVRTPSLKGVRPVLDGATPLMVATLIGEADTVLLLLALGADTDLTNSKGQTALDIVDIARETGRKAAALDIIAQALSDLTARKEHVADFLNEALFDATRKQDGALVGILLRVGGNPKAEADDEKIIIYAVKKGSGDIVDQLLNAGADPNVFDENGEDTALMEAVRKENIEVTKLLLKAGAQPNTVGDRNQGPLYWAASRGNVEIFEILLEAGADTEVRNERGVTPLERVDPEQRAEFEALVARYR